MMEAASATSDLPGTLAVLVVLGYILWIILAHKRDNKP